MPANELPRPSSPLVSTAWLAERIGQPDLRIIDASWYLPAMNRDGRREFEQDHIPGAVFFDLDEISDPSSDLPHMLPDPAGFGSAVAALGIDDSDEIIVYDGAGLFSAPRVWWMLRIFGARHVHVLDGGLPKWKAEGRPLEQGATSRAKSHFAATFDETAVAAMADVAQALDDRSTQVLDMRAAGRFAGEAPEPRPNLASGHMPGALNLPASDLVVDGRLKPAGQLLDAFASAGVDLDKPLITSCGSGVSAAIANLALAVAGQPEPKLYDGSWTEWASGGKPIAKGRK